MTARVTLCALLLSAFALMNPRPALAGDYAERAVLGFSVSGRYFAFEQFGRQDGSGFAYADIHAIDAEADAWLPGSPIRVLLRDETATVAMARAEALKQAAAIMEKAGISAPGSLLASNPPAELGQDPKKLALNARFPLSGEPEAFEFALEDIPLESPACAGLSDQPTNGFRLILKRPDAAPEALHADTAIPKSRGCPLRYAISDVFRYRGPDQTSTYAVLISVFRIGFEGPDRRFIAVTHRRP